MKKHLTLLLLLVSVAVFFFSCKSITTTLTGDFATRASFQGIARNGAVVFVIGNQAFIGTGYNKDNNKWLRDFYVYDVVKNSWAPIAPLPAAGRVNAVAFSAGGKGYVGTGYSNDGGVNKNLNDFYSYDPASNTWTAVANLPGPTRRGAVSFSINNTGYVGTGVSYDTTGVTNGLGDFYAYNPSSDQWKSISGYPGQKVNGAFSFVLNGQAYVGGGSSNGVSNQFFTYNPAGDIWYKKARLDSNISGIQRSYCVSFAINNTGYITTGSGLQTTFSYNPGNDTWTQAASFEGSYRSEAVGFAVTGLANNYNAFIGLGTPGASSTPFDDWWAFNPSIATVANN